MCTFLQSHYCFVLLTFLFSARQMSDSQTPAELEALLRSRKTSETCRNPRLEEHHFIDRLSTNTRFLFWIYRSINTNSNKKQELMSLTSLWDLFICGVIHRHLAISTLSCKMAEKTNLPLSCLWWFIKHRRFRPRPTRMGVLVEPNQAELSWVEVKLSD